MDTLLDEAGCMKTMLQKRTATCCPLVLMWRVRVRKKIIGIALLMCMAAAIAWLMQKKPQEITPAAPVSGRDFMQASLTYDEGLRTLRGTQTLDAQNRGEADRDNIVLRLYMNGWEGCSAVVSGVSVNGESTAYAQDADDPTVLTIDYPWKAQEEITIGWTVMIRHAKAEGAALITLPGLAMYENGAWRTDAYDDLADPSYAEAFDYVIELDGGIAAQMRMARDASFALGRGTVKEKELRGVRIRAMAQDSRTAKLLLDQAETALKSLNDAGIAYPYDALTIAQTNTGREDGLALSGLIALEADADKEQLLRKITRLIALQAFGIWIESDPWNAPWLSRTLASCAELLAYRERRGAAAYEERLYGELELSTRLTRPAGVTVGASTAHFGSDSEMTQVLRDQGAAMLLGVEQAIGKDAFVTALTLYAQQCGAKTGSFEALQSALEQASGSSWTGYLTDMLAF